MALPDENSNQKEVLQFKMTGSDVENGQTKEVDSCSKKNFLSKILEIRVNKPLIPLKIAIFCWFAGCSALGPFLALYLKQLGLRLNELSIIYMVTPVIQIFAPSLSGIVADKIGKSKPVLQANLLITLLAANIVLFFPESKNDSCSKPLISCYSQTLSNDSAVIETCNIYSNESHVICGFNCSTEPSPYISDSCFQSYIASCYFSSKNDILINLTLPEYTLDNETAMNCIEESSHTNSSWCAKHFVRECSSTCMQNTNYTEDADCHPYTKTSTVFILSLIFVTTYLSFLSTAYRIFDVTAMSMVKTHDSDFGRQRVWAIVGTMISTPLSGYVISLVSPQTGSQKYEVAFYIFDILVVVAVLIVWKLDVKIEPPARGMLKKAKSLIKNLDILVFIFIIFIIGTTWGFTRSYSSWYLQDLGAPSTLIGLLVALGSFIGLPFLFTSSWFIKKIGSSNLLLLCLVAYVIWCTGYSFLVNPWWSLIYQIMEIPTYHLLWVTAVTHSHSIAPPGLRATVIATAGGVHYGIGKGSGGLIGGFVMSNYGGRVAYRVMAIICAGTAALYALYLHFKKKGKKKETEVKNTEA